jgi:hypothetical protein
MPSQEHRVNPFFSNEMPGRHTVLHERRLWEIISKSLARANPSHTDAVMAWEFVNNSSKWREALVWLCTVRVFAAEELFFLYKIESLKGYRI